MDFFTVPTLTFGILYCFFIIGHDRRRILQNIISGAGNAGDSGGPVFRCFQSSDPDRNFECPGPRPEKVVNVRLVGILWALSSRGAIRRTVYSPIGSMTDGTVRECSTVMNCGR